MGPQRMAVEYHTHSFQIQTATPEDVAEGVDQSKLVTPASIAGVFGAFVKSDASNLDDQAFREALGIVPIEGAISDLAAGKQDALGYTPANSALSNVGDRKSAVTSGLGLNDVTPEQFGAAVGASPAANAVAFAAAWAYTVSSGVQLRCSGRRLYQISQVDVPASALTVGRLRLQPITVANPSNPTDITVNDDASFEDLVIELPAPAQSGHSKTVALKNGVTISGRLEIKALPGTQRAGGGVSFEGNDISVGWTKSNRVDRPFYQDSTDGGPAWTGLSIGRVTIASYVRGWSIRGAVSGNFGGGVMRGKSPNAAKDAGHNSFLLGGLVDFRFGDFDLGNSGEHAIRGGGSTVHNGVLQETNGVAFGNVVVRNSGGCAVKMNDGGVVGNVVGGDKTYIRNVTFASLIGYDVGDGSGTSNSELIRLSHVRGFSIIGGASAKNVTTSVSCRSLLKCVDCDGVYIGPMEGVNVRFSAVDFTAEQPGDWPGPTPSVRNLLVAGMKSVFTASSPPVYAIEVNLAATAGDPGGDPLQGPTPAGSLDNVSILNCDVAGMTTGLARWRGSTGVAGAVTITGVIRGGKAGSFTTVPDDERIRLDVQMLSADALTLTTYKGKAANYIASSGYVDRSPNGTAYRLAQPPNGGGAATWVAA